MGASDALTWRTGGPRGGHKRSVSATTAGNSSAWAMSGAGRASAALQYMPTRTPHLKSSKSFSNSHAGASLSFAPPIPAIPTGIHSSGGQKDTEAPLGGPRRRVTVDSWSSSRATTSMPAPSGGGDGASGAGTGEKERKMMHPFAAPFRFPAAPGPDAGCGFAAGRREAAAAAATAATTTTVSDAGRQGVSGTSVERRNDMGEAAELDFWEQPSLCLMGHGKADGDGDGVEAVESSQEAAVRRPSPALSDSSLATVRAVKRQSGAGNSSDASCTSRTNCASCAAIDGLSAPSDAKPTVTATTPPPHHHHHHHRQLLQFPASRSPWAQHARRLVSASSSTSSTCSSPPPLFSAAAASASCTSLALASSSPKHHTPSSSVSSTTSTASTASVASSATTASSLSFFPAPPPLFSTNTKNQHHRRRSSSRQSPAMPEYRHGRAASLSITGASAGSPQSRSGNANSVMPRSPPSKSESSFGLCFVSSCLAFFSNHMSFASKGSPGAAYRPPRDQKPRFSNPPSCPPLIFKAPLCASGAHTTPCRSPAYRSLAHFTNMS